MSKAPTKDTQAVSADAGTKDLKENAPKADNPTKTEEKVENSPSLKDQNLTAKLQDSIQATINGVKGLFIKDEDQSEPKLTETTTLNPNIPRITVTNVQGIENREKDVKGPDGKYRPGLARMKHLEKYSDLKLIVGPSKSEYPVHKMILLGHSPKFEKSLDTTTTPHSITIPDAEEETFEQILEYLYCEKFPNTNIFETAKLYVAANELGMTALRVDAVADFCEKVKQEGFFVKPNFEDFFDEKGNETEALKRYDGDKAALIGAFLAIFEDYGYEIPTGGKDQSQIMPYGLTKMLEVLKDKGCLGTLLDQPLVRRFFKGNAAASFAVLTYYRSRDHRA